MRQNANLRYASMVCKNERRKTKRSVVSVAFTVIYLLARMQKGIVGCVHNYLSLENLQSTKRVNIYTFVKYMRYKFSRGRVLWWWGFSHTDFGPRWIGIAK